AVHENLNFYMTRDVMENPLVPDVAVVKGVPYAKRRSWRVGRTGPPPQVVFEILSQETWEKDCGEKLRKYALMGMQEYFTYDPHEPPVVRDAASRLRGWYLNPILKEMVEITPDAQWRLWSTQLDSWL